MLAWCHSSLTSKRLLINITNKTTALFTFLVNFFRLDCGLFSFICVSSQLKESRATYLLAYNWTNKHSTLTLYQKYSSSVWKPLCYMKWLTRKLPCHRWVLCSGHNEESWRSESPSVNGESCGTKSQRRKQERHEHTCTSAAAPSREQQETNLMSDRLPVIFVGRFRRRFCRTHVDFGGFGGDCIILLMKEIRNQLELRGHKPRQFEHAYSGVVKMAWKTLKH